MLFHSTRGTYLYSLIVFQLSNGSADCLVNISTTNGDTPARATLKLVYAPTSPDDEDESDLDSEEEAMQMQQLLGAAPDSDDDDDDLDEFSSDDEDKNGGPSDPAKSKKARKEAAAARLLKALKQEGSDEDMEDTSSSPLTNGLSSKKNKGKAKASLSDDEESSDEEDDDEAEGLEELVLCTLDPNQVGNLAVSSCLEIANAASAIPTNVGSYNTRRSDCVLQGLWNSRHLFERQLCRPSGGWSGSR